MQIWNIAASFTRPNNTTAYSSGQLVANSTTAGSVVPLSFPMGNRFPNGRTRLTRARISKTGTGITNASFRIHIYGVLPTLSNGDGAAWLSNNAANWLGNIDVTSMLAFSDGAAGTGSAPAGSEMFLNVPGANIYALLMAQGAYTPVANEVFTVTLETLDEY